MNSTTTPTPLHADFLLIGGGITAITAAQTLRSEGATGSIAVLSAEPDYPYNRPPLTKGIITGDLVPEQILVATPERYLADAIDIHRDTTVQSVDPSTRTVTDQAGTPYQYGKLLIATGARARRLHVPGADLDGVFSFRTIADAMALRAWVLANRGPVAILGTSFIAMELATSFTSMGIQVTLIDRHDSVFPRIHSETLSAHFLQRCQDHGISVRLGESIRQIHGSTNVSGVETTTGAKIACTTLITAIGAVAQTDFLKSSGLLVNDGVLVDEFLQTNQPDIFAAGDVASYIGQDGSRQRAGHWDNARRQGRLAAKNMLGQRLPYNRVLHYFCDFLDFSFTFLGTSENADTRITRGDLDRKSFAEFYIHANRITGLFTTGRPPEETRVVETLIRERVNIHTSIAQLSDPTAKIDSLAKETVLILQGGAALGAFECGVVQAMDEARIAPKIIGGVSIGAINGAIIAGNPDNATAALEAFWNEISVYAPQATSASSASAIAVGTAMTQGIPAFFTPRWLTPVVNDEWWPHQWTSLYDASPIKKLLSKYVDFPKLSKGPVRLIVAAVDVELGELVFFDSQVDELTPDHILASGSLPPVFPWTTINGRHYWDGGVISNSPLEHVLATTGPDNKQVFLVDLFPGKRPLPTNLGEVLTRRDEITYGERIRNDSQIRELAQEFQALVSEIMMTIKPDVAARLQQRPRYVQLMGRHGTTTSITRIVRDGSSRESLAAHYDFSAQTISRLKNEGYLATKEILKTLD